MFEPVFDLSLDELADLLLLAGEGLAVVAASESEKSVQVT